MIAILAAITLSSIQPKTEPSPYFLDNSTVVQMDCDGGLGTAFHIGDKKFITAKHVVVAKPGKLDKCKINGKPVTVLELGPKTNDYALVTADVDVPYRAILSCDGFKEGETYYATGYADGNKWTVTQRLIAGNYQFHSKKLLWNGTTFLRGGTTEGQSGGPVSDNDGRVVGIVSHGEEEGITEQLLLSLSDTPICKADK